ncbi:MAG: hypothetical protein GXP54_01315 [Deltaproteobacteria bacterium]|nr:hypothetical protein [Deltaproteobacteria bacterium]
MEDAISKRIGQAAWEKLGVAAVMIAAVVLVLPHRYAITTFHEANTAGRVYAVQSLVHYGTWNLAPILCRSGFNHSIVDLSEREGVPYLEKAPGVSWLGVPVYAVLAAANGGKKLPFHWTAMALGLLCVFLPVMVVALLLRREWSPGLGSRASSIAVVVLLLATPFHVYSAMFQDYPLATMMLMAGWILIRRRSPWLISLGGLLLGYAGVVNYAFFLYGGLVGAVELARRVAAGEEWKLFSLTGVASAALPVLCLMVYDATLFGGPFTTAYAFMINEGQRVSHARVAFSLGTLLRDFIGPKHGIFFIAPWTPIGLAGLLAALREPRHRWLCLTGLAVVIATLGFSSFWETSNADDMAFDRHLMPVFPWLAWGFGWMVQRALTQSRVIYRALIGFGAAGVAVGWFYELVTVWTFPYHSSRLFSPLWQVSIPLFMNGGHQPSVFYNLFEPYAPAVLPPGTTGCWWAVRCWPR